MSQTIRYKSNLSKQELSNLSVNAEIPLNNFINTTVKKAGVDSKKIRKFLKCIKRYLDYIKKYPEGSETTQRTDGLEKQVLDPTFPNQDFEVNKGKEDLSILNKLGDTRVIIEYKALSKKAEMMQPKSLNRKAFGELVEYYLAERNGHYMDNGVQYINDNNIEYNNREPITGIVTNGFDWFIISDNTFKKYFHGQLLNDYDNWIKDGLNKSTDHFRQAYISPAIDSALKNGMKVGYFNLNNMAKGTLYSPKHSDKITRSEKEFYEFLSPQNLLQRPAENTPNKLNKKFYNELLYIMGLKEVSDGNTHKITMLAKPDTPAYKNYRGTLIEQLYSLNPDITFKDALNIVMSFIDRVLFLKLLESELRHDNPKQAKELSFMAYDKRHISNFNNIDTLFFQIMAKSDTYRRKKLSESVYEKYQYVPYLNSSLFKRTNVEKHYDIRPSRLQGQIELKLYPHSLIKRFYPTSSKNLPILRYLLEFLGSYHFDANSHSINNGNGRNTGYVINAAILGMVFEKINGYKQGSYFTPDNVAAHMAKKAIDTSLAAKFNNDGIKVTNPSYLERDIKRDLSVLIQTNGNESRQKYLKIYQNKARNILDNFTIVDPAVGSGHFLVAALNYLLKLRFDLHVLGNTNTNKSSYLYDLYDYYSLDYDYNGQLWLRNGNNLYKYQRNISKSSYIQKLLFNTKRDIIENNLFGVDINPSSVGITKLRLWIELLKNAYYKQNGHMVTMPNLETNIKTGNSLMTHLMASHYVLSQDEFHHMKVSISKLQKWINNYDHSHSRNDESLEYKQIQDAISRMAVYANLSLLSKNSNLLQTNLVGGYANSHDSQKHKRRKRLVLAIMDDEHKLRRDPISSDESEVDMDLTYISKIRKDISKITGYNTFEWTYEFPQLLTVKGKHVKFKGFDLILTNPPYISDKFTNEEKDFFKSYYRFSKRHMNSFELFIELSLYLTHQGCISMIIPNTFLTASQYNNIRHYLLKHTSNMSVLNSKDKIFSAATIDNCIILLQKEFKPKSEVKGYLLRHNKIKYMGEKPANYLATKSTINVYSFSNNTLLPSILSTMKENGTPIESLIPHTTNKWTPNYGVVKNGVKIYEGGKGCPKQPKLKKDSNGNYINKDECDRFIKTHPYVTICKNANNKYNRKFLAKGNLARYGLKWNNHYIEYGNNLAAKRDENIFKGPRILINQVLNSGSPYALEATYVNKEYICSQDADIIHTVNINLFALLAVLNSKVVGLYLILDLGLLQRSFWPKILVKDIKSILIPKISKSNQIRLAKYAKIMMNPKKQSKHKQTNKRIDQIVMNAFKFDSKQQKYIKNFALKNKH